VIRLPGNTGGAFQLQDEEGWPWSFGLLHAGLPEEGSLHQPDSLSLGLVVQLSAVLAKQVKISELLEDSRSNPMITPYPEGRVGGVLGPPHSRIRP